MSELSPQQALERANYLSSLLQWIEDARMTLDYLAEARTDKAVDEALRAAHVSCPMEWTRRESTALHELHAIQQDAMAVAMRAL